MYILYMYIHTYLYVHIFVCVYLWVTLEGTFTENFLNFHQDF